MGESGWSVWATRSPPSALLACCSCVSKGESGWVKGGRGLDEGGVVLLAYCRLSDRCFGYDGAWCGRRFGVAPMFVVVIVVRVILVGAVGGGAVMVPK